MTVHIFRSTNPVPAEWRRWMDGPRRAACTCGWTADTNSGNTASASARWRVEHYATLQGGAA